MTKNLVWLFGIIFVIVGVLGFIPGNKIVGEGALFEANPLHSVIHLLSGVIAIAAAVSGEAMARNYLRIFGVVYALVAVLGFTVGSSGDLFGIITTNAADNWLHVVLAIVFLWAGFMGSKSVMAPASGSSMMGQMK